MFITDNAKMKISHDVEDRLLLHILIILLLKIQLYKYLIQFNYYFIINAFIF